MKGAAAGADVFDVIDFVGTDFDGFVFEVGGFAGEGVVVFVIVFCIEGVGIFVVNGGLFIGDGW